MPKTTRATPITAISAAVRTAPFAAGVSARREYRRMRSAKPPAVRLPNDVSTIAARMRGTAARATITGNYGHLAANRGDEVPFGYTADPSPDASPPAHWSIVTP